MSQRRNTLKLFSGVLLAGLLTKRHSCCIIWTKRHGILLTPEQPWTTHYRLAAW